MRSPSWILEYPEVRVEMVQREPESALRETWAQDFDLVIAEQYPAHICPASGTRSAYADDRRDPARDTAVRSWQIHTPFR
jgi:hypothetical protein